MTTTHTRVALITGAGTGIGKAAAKALRGAGYAVVLTGRKLDKLEAAMSAIGATADNALAIACDVGNPDEVKALFASVKALMCCLTTPVLLPLRYRPTSSPMSSGWRWSTPICVGLFYARKKQFA